MRDLDVIEYSGVTLFQLYFTNIKMRQFVTLFIVMWSIH